MLQSSVADRKANKEEVLRQAPRILVLAGANGLTSPPVRDHGSLIVHSDEPGYRAVTRLSAAASELVGRYVHVITDEVAGPPDAQEL